MKIQSKLPDVATTVFTTMSHLATQYDAVNLGQGFPDFPMSEELVDLVAKAMQDGYNQYAPMAGLPLLRERIAGKIFELYDVQRDPGSEITITPGGTYAIFTALTSILRPGDEVIVFEPAYDSYIPNILVNGAIPVRIPLRFPDYSIPWEIVKEKVSSRTKAIIANSPHNPTGTIITETDIEQLKSLVSENDLCIISDEVYEHLVFDGKQHLSILRYPELAKNAFVCFSFGKTYHSTGWKIGYCVAPGPLMQEFRKVHQYNCFSVNTPAQIGLAEYLLQKDAYLQLGTFVQKKRDYFEEMMKRTVFKPLANSGSYFQCYSFDGLSALDDQQFAIMLTREFRVTSIPVSAFYTSREDNKVIRFCFCKKEETLERAVAQLAGYNGDY